MLHRIMNPIRVGIDALGLAFPRAYVALEDVARARGVPETKYTEGLGTVAMSVPEPDEDTVTLAVEAAADALERADVDASEIGLCIVGTETAVDHSKPVASFLQGLLGLPSTCRIFEAKHACYGGTAGLMTALDWIASGRARGRKALVVCSDIARYGLNTPGEPTQGAGSVALVVSENPRVLSIDTATIGTSSQHVFDFWRPLESKDAFVDGHYSVTCYLEALRGAHAEHLRLGGRTPGDDLAATLYHVPYPKMAKKAHALMRELAGDNAPDQSYARLVAPSLVLPSRIGNIYTGSLYLALASLLACSERPVHGQDVTLFSYGSGCCAELFRGTITPGAQAAYASLRARVDARRKLTVAEYEALFRARDEVRELDALPVSMIHDLRSVRLKGVQGGRRIYA